MMARIPTRVAGRAAGGLLVLGAVVGQAASRQGLETTVVFLTVLVVVLARATLFVARSTRCDHPLGSQPFGVVCR
jgi:hypothetical protein